MTNKCLSANRFSAFIIFIFIATSSFPSFIIFRKFIPILLPFIIFRLVKNNQIAAINNLLKGSIILLIFSVAQYLLGHVSLAGGLSFLLIMITIISSTSFIKDSFTSIYVKIIKFICSLSLIIWILVVIVPGIHDLLSVIGSYLPQLITNEWLEKTTNPGTSLYLYYLPESTYSGYTSFIRNNGPFYEPGLFASYIVIALVFNTMRTRKLLKKDNLTLILSLLSTCSSAGYISLGIIILFSVSFQKKWYFKILSVAAILVLFQPVMELNFMADKVASNFENADFSASSRFGAILYHLEKVIESPWVGYAGGQMPVTDFDRFLGGYIENRLSPNGLSYAFVYWGVPLALVFYYLLYKGIVHCLPFNISLSDKIIVYIIFLSTAFSQTITTDPILLLIASIPLVNDKFSKSHENRGNSYI